MDRHAPVLGMAGAESGDVIVNKPQTTKAQPLTSTKLEVLRLPASANIPGAPMTSSSLKDSSLYLQRLGYTTAPPPTLDTLRQLVQRHTEAFPFETLTTF